MAAFGSIYAAYALYGFIGPTIAFLALGATGLACMAAAALHGPALAALGLLGSLATPVLVSSQRPNPWPVVLYLAVVVAAAYLLSRVRGWLWLALASAAGAGLWALLLRSLADPDRSGDLLHAALLHVLLQTALASYFLAIDPHRGESDEAAVFDPPANAVLAALGIVALFVLHLDYHWSWFGGVWLLAAAGVIAILGLTGARTAAAAGASASAGVVALAALMLWPPVIGSPAQWPSSAIFTARWPAPAEPMWFALFAAVSCLGVGAAAGRRLLDGPRLRFGLAGFYAGAAALTPLGGLIIADLRLSGGAPSIAMSIAAALVGAVLAFGASRFRDKPGAGEATRLGLGALASGAIGAVGAGLVFALDGGALIVALALAAVGTAFVAARLDIGALRWCVAALGVAVAGRLAWEPRIVGDALSATPVFNWLLFGYGVPAAAFAQAARFMRQRAEDTPVRVADALAILFSAFLFFFEIRHAMNSGDPYAPGSGLVEQALLAVSSFGFAVVLTRLDAARANVVFRYASLGAGALGMALAAWGLLLRYNPLFDGRPVEGGAVLNALILGYLIPALLAAALALVARRVRPLWYWGGAGALGGVLSLLYAALQVRIFFHGSSIGFEQGAGVAELGVDVCLCLTLAGALLLRAPSTKPSLIVRGSMAFSALAAAIGVVGLAGLANPLVSGAPIGGGGAFNALIIGYALPSLFTLILARLARRMREPLYAAAASFAAIAWLFAYASLEVRRAFQGPTIGFEQWTSNGRVVRLFRRLAAARHCAPRLWRLARLARSAVRFSFFRRRDGGQGVLVRPRRARGHLAGRLFHRPGACVDRDRPGLSETGLCAVPAVEGRRGRSATSNVSCEDGFAPSSGHRRWRLGSAPARRNDASLAAGPLSFERRNDLRIVEIVGRIEQGIERSAFGGVEGARPRACMTGRRIGAGQHIGGAGVGRSAGVAVARRPALLIGERGGRQGIGRDRPGRRGGIVALDVLAYDLLVVDALHDQSHLLEVGRAGRERAARSEQSLARLSIGAQLRQAPGEIGARGGRFRDGRRRQAAERLRVDGLERPMHLGWRRGGGRNDRNGVGRQPILGVLFDFAPVLHILQMLFERIGEGVAAGSVGHEVEVLGRQGLATASSAALPGLVIGPGGRPSDDVGVVGRRLVEFALGKQCPSVPLPPTRP